MALPSDPARRAVVAALAGLALGIARTGHAQNWSQLNAEEQRILAPLEEDWPNIEQVRREKWIGIARRYDSLSPQQRERLQARMREWAALSPEERAQVRERYKRLKEMPPEKREAIKRKWREYDSLTEEEKDTLRQAHPANKP